MTIIETIEYSVMAFLGTGVLSYLLGAIVLFLAKKFEILDYPKKKRKIQKKPIPLLGGEGIGFSLLISLFLAYIFILNSLIPIRQLLSFMVGIFILLIGGFLDDKYDLKPRISFIFPLLSVLVLVLVGRITINTVTNPITHTGWLINYWQFDFFQLIKVNFPGDILTIVWMLLAIYATKFTDGLDGLVTGISIIGSVIIGLLSLVTAFFQPLTVILSGIIAGAFAGFLPRNYHPAKQFLGESGSTLAGFVLGFLAIVSSAKVAITLAVLAVPIIDVFVVIIKRWRQHKSIFQGDSTHLHFRLLNLGFSHVRIVWFFWLISAMVGIMALFLQTSGKIFLFVLIFILMLLFSWYIDRLLKKNV